MATDRLNTIVLRTGLTLTEEQVDLIFNLASTLLL